MDEGLRTLQAIKQVIADAGPYVVLVVLAFFYLRYTRQREHEQNAVSIVQAETQNAGAANTASLIQLTERLNRAFTDLSERQERQTERMIAALQDVANGNVERAKAIQQQAAVLDSFSQAFGNEINGMKTAINAAGEQMTASRNATDARLSSIQADVEYSNKAIDEAKTVIETLPVDTTKVVLELGDKAANDHKRIIEAADKLSAQIEQLPNYLVKSLAPVVDELKAAAQRLEATESKLIEVVKTVVPPPREFALAKAEALPLADRPLTDADRAAIADMRRDVGVA